MQNNTHVALLHTALKTAIALGAALSILALVGAWNLWTHSGSTAGLPALGVSGEGRVTAAPDVAEINFSVITQGVDAQAISKENNSRVDAVIAYLKSQGVEEKDVKTTSYSLYPQYDYEWCRIAEPYPTKGCTPKISGYQISHSVEATVRDISRIPAVVSGLTDKKVNNISNVSYTFSEEAKARLTAEARGKAVKDAKEKAKNIAQTAGVRLGKIVSISESSSFQPVPYGGIYAMGDRGGGGAPIEPGTQDIVLNVSLSFRVW